jgi:ABC-2 type transport system ATP-binding protein
VHTAPGFRPAGGGPSPLPRFGETRKGRVVESALVVEDLRKAYGTVVAVNGVDFTVAEGEIFGILGPNGSGKTTTVECAYGLRKADAGRIRIFGVDPQEQPDRAAELIGIQLQDSALPDRLKTWEALRLFGELGRRSPGATATASGRATNERDVLEQWGLAEKRNAAFASLSGGQRQRLLVALALVNRPRLVFLDEMTTGLDPAARRDAWHVIQQARQAGTTVVLVTHFMDEAEELCDRICVLSQGRLVAQDTPARLISTYGGGIRVRFDVPDDVALPDWDRLPGLREAHRLKTTVELRGSGSFLTALGAALTAAGLGDTDLSVEQPRLEDVYLRLTNQAEEI